MLVLTRRLHEKVRFPAFNTAIEVLSVKAGKVRLGIEAPAAVVVLREELCDQTVAAPMSAGNAAEPTKLRRLHELVHNRLDVAEIGLAVLTRQLQEGLHQEVQTTVEKIHEDINLLRQRLNRELWAAANDVAQLCTQAMHTGCDENAISRCGSKPRSWTTLGAASRRESRCLVWRQAKRQSVSA